MAGVALAVGSGPKIPVKFKSPLQTKTQMKEKQKCQSRDCMMHLCLLCDFFVFVLVVSHCSIPNLAEFSSSISAGSAKETGNFFSVFLCFVLFSILSQGFLRSVVPLREVGWPLSSPTAQHAGAHTVPVQSSGV